MAEIKDTGKVWFPGTFGPEQALRVEDKVFVPGKEADQSIDCRVVGNFLIVDLHDKKKEERILRRFSLDLPATTPATLFNGFDKTKHADVRVVTYKDSGVEEIIVAGDTYRTEAIAGMDSESFCQRFANIQRKDELAG